MCQPYPLEDLATPADIATAYGSTTEHLRQIEVTAIGKLRRYIAHACATRFAAAPRVL